MCSMRTKYAHYCNMGPILLLWGMICERRVHFSSVMTITLKPKLSRLPAAGKEARVSRPAYKKLFFLSLFLRVHPNRLWQLRLVILSHVHPRWDKNHWFIPLKETMNLPVLFIWESPSPPEILQGKNFCFSIRQRKYPSIHSLDIGNESPCLSK